ncbi:MAG TPA: IS200/IS605 family transposase [Verrucomicrobiae bacterium]|jgi:REP element-mobilizing transposase RayT|nr:IS200/IS605 family transposase [Verrucomicrobiae bacterium]
MANTYTQIYVQIVFVIEARQCLIRGEHKEELQKYISGVITRQGQKLLAISCMPDHTHVLIGLKPNIALSDLAGDIKTGSTNHINRQKWMPGKFSWQEGFGAFSYSHSQLTEVIRYIQNQEAHHSKKSFREEYLNLLNKFEVPFDERYVFKEV